MLEWHRGVGLNIRGKDLLQNIIHTSDTLLMVKTCRYFVMSSLDFGEPRRCEMVQNVANVVRNSLHLSTFTASIPKLGKTGKKKDAKKTF